MKGNLQNSKNQVDVGQFLRMSERPNRKRSTNEDIDAGEFFRSPEGKSISEDNVLKSKIN